ncbi:MAG: 2-C-methyl-D-erythritol 2,4-cyclodiphosphate synthase [Actinomycetota bacterium]|nr:2-C-methyl-D-erythritol 2,4-cyclodiphosphate synthase [Actinomycetota bacterium]
MLAIDRSAAVVRVGVGFDAHQFSEDTNRPLVLGGKRIEGSRGLEGHSDADAVVHALCDAILGAAGLGDIGRHFPDDDPDLVGVDSTVILAKVVAMIANAGWMIANADCTILAEEPVLGSHLPAMSERLSLLAGAPVNVKATRAERMGAIGRGEGIACFAVVLVEPDGS